MVNGAGKPHLSNGWLLGRDLQQRAEGILNNGATRRPHKKLACGLNNIWLLQQFKK
jgi:hypothetical protein